MHTKSSQISTASQTEVIRRFSKAKPLAARFGVCPKTIARWGAAGLISRYKLNPRVVLFDPAEILAYIEKGRIL
jgi:hypothetical protein